MSARRPFALAVLLICAVLSALMVEGAAGQENGMSVTVELHEYDHSGISGTAVLSETTTNGTHVSMVLVGAELDGNHPTHIHTGTCDNFDPNPLYPLETVNLNPDYHEGVSESTVEDVDLTKLYEGKYVILVHQSPEELTKYLVCGEISSGTVGTADRVAPGDPATTHHMPATGAGSSVGNEIAGTGFLVLVSALALVSAVTAGAIRKTWK
jgi:hypothetical protein